LNGRAKPDCARQGELAQLKDNQFSPNKNLTILCPLATILISFQRFDNLLMNSLKEI